MELKDQIKIAREALGWSREELAAKVKVSRQSIVWWEEGWHRPKATRIRQLEEELQVRLDLSERGAAMPLDPSDASPSVNPEVLRLAVAISRLPRAQRDAITTLTFMGEKKALPLSTSSDDETPSNAHDENIDHEQKTADRMGYAKAPKTAGEFNIIEQGKKGVKNGVTSSKVGAPASTSTTGRGRTKIAR